jgi:putative SbcD/Mre11-related phosphoesterase
VVADVHLGYEWARGAGGDQVPAHSLRETLQQLSALLERVEVQKLVVAGDLVERARPCPSTQRDVAALRGWLRERGVALEWLRGNHDPPSVQGLASRLELAGWTIAHGDRPLGAGKIVLGHLHPVLRAGATCSRCFLIGPDAIVLPAFSHNAAGWNVAGGWIPRELNGRADLRCLAASGDAVLDFGPLDTLANRLAQKKPGAASAK